MNDELPNARAFVLRVEERLKNLEVVELELEDRLQQLAGRVEKFSQLAQRWLATSEYHSEQLGRIERLIIELQTSLVDAKRR
jgi:hypothetical protein